MYVYTSYRGSGLRLQDAIVTSVPFGRLSILADEAFSSLNDIEGHKFVYFLCGIPDITFKYQEKGEGNYEEVVFFNNNTAFNFKTLMYVFKVDLIQLIVHLSFVLFQQLI